MDGSIVDSAEKDISALLAEQVDGIIADKLQNVAHDKLALSQFREYLKELSEEEGCPVVFIIDELDRCRPDFALELVEQIKHLFSVPGITFLLVVNRVQLQESIKYRYGNGVEATKYLQKFVNLWLSLPRKSELYRDNGTDYIRHSLALMLNEGEELSNQDVIDLLCELTKFLKPSFREIEQILSYFALVHNMTGSSSYHAPYQTMIAFVCYLKASKPELLNKIENEKITGKGLIEAVGLPSSFKVNTEHNHIKYLCELIIFDLAQDGERKQMIKDVTSTGGIYQTQKGLMKKISSWLVEISVL